MILNPGTVLYKLTWMSDPPRASPGSGTPPPSGKDRRSCTCLALLRLLVPVFLVPGLFLSTALEVEPRRTLEMAVVLWHRA